MAYDTVVVVVTIAAARLAIFGIIAALLVVVLGLVAMYVARFTRKIPAGPSAWTWRVCSCCRETFYSRDRNCDRHDNCNCARARYGVCRPCSSFVVVPVFGSASLSFKLFAVSLFELKL